MAACLLLAPAALAVSGNSSRGSAAAAQYPVNDQNQTLGGEVSSGLGGGGGGGGGSNGGGGGGGGLPFTGFAVLSVAGLGALVLSGGIVLRRSTNAW